MKPTVFSRITNLTSASLPAKSCVDFAKPIGDPVHDQPQLLVAEIIEAADWRRASAFTCSSVSRLTAAASLMRSAASCSSVMR